jgi:hypothetical protein
MTNMIGRLQAGAMALAAVLAASLAATPTVAAEEQTVNAQAAYTSEGKIYQTGENKGTFVGALVGELFVDSKKGPLHAGRLVCPGMMALDLENGTQAGNGRCTLTAKDGAQIFAVWSCRGVHLVGCDGRMMLTGGTGRTTGASGSGSLTVRPTSRLLIKASSEKSSVEHLGRGILFLRDFKYKKPSK